MEEAEGLRDDESSACNARGVSHTRRPFPSNDNSTSTSVNRSTYFGYKYMSSVDDCPNNQTSVLSIMFQ